jgi:hypothetical protein
MYKKVMTACCVAVFLLTLPVAAQTIKKEYFNISSPTGQSDRNYGTLTVTAEKSTVVIGTIMAYGENVKGLTIQINNGFPFKLAPSQSGSILNYVGSTLNIVLQPGDKATISFLNAGRGSAARHLYAACERIESL